MYSQPYIIIYIVALPPHKTLQIWRYWKKSIPKPGDWVLEVWYFLNVYKMKMEKADF